MVRVFLGRSFRGVVDAVQYLHDRGLVHCDLKPSNILVNDEPDARWMVCDFGITAGATQYGSALVSLCGEGGLVIWPYTRTKYAREVEVLCIADFATWRGNTAKLTE